MPRTPLDEAHVHPAIRDTVASFGADIIGEVKAAIAANEQRIAGKGRILIRKSGTEPLIRVMAECEDAGLLEDVVQDIVSAVQRAALIQS